MSCSVSLLLAILSCHWLEKKLRSRWAHAASCTAWGNGVSAQLWWTLSLRSQVLSLNSSAYASTVAARLVVFLWRDKFPVGNHFTYGFDGMGVNLDEALYRQTDYFLGVRSGTALNQSKGGKKFPNLHSTLPITLLSTLPINNNDTAARLDYNINLN